MQSPFVNIMQCPRNTVAGSKARVDEGMIASPYHALIIMQLEHGIMKRRTEKALEFEH